MFNVNNVVWNEDIANARQLGLKATHIWGEWAVLTHRLLDEQQHNDARRDMHRWQHPPQGVMWMQAFIT
jgi:hypothetical protein